MLKIILGLSLLLCSIDTFAVVTVPQHNDLSKARLSSLQCLAVNLYHESRSESDIANMFIVGVVLNRVNDRRYPNDICKVVFDESAFSWTGDGLPDNIYNEKQYQRLYKIVEYVLLNKQLVLSMTEGVDHYHTVSINPYWANSEVIQYVTTIDNHKFYRWKKRGE